MAVLAALDLPSTGTALSAMGAVVFGIYQGFRAAALKKEKNVLETDKSLSEQGLAQNYKELASVHNEKANEWKTLYENEHKESQTYRQIVHDQRQQANVEHLKLVEENAILSARTNLTPIIAYIEKGQATNERVADALAKLTEVISSLVEDRKERE